MARAKKQTATAEEFNAEQEAVRQEARDADTNVVDLLGTRQCIEVEDQYARDMAAQLDDILDRKAKAAADEKALRNEFNANGRTWAGLVELVKLRRMTEKRRRRAEEKLAKMLEERAKVARAFGWDKQIDLFAAPEPTAQHETQPEPGPDSREAWLASPPGTPAPSFEGLPMVAEDEPLQFDVPPGQAEETAFGPMSDEDLVRRLARKARGEAVP